MTVKPFTIGQRVRIDPDVTRTAWGPPCDWGGRVGVITSFGGRFGGKRLWRVLPDGMECTFGGNDFVEGVLEPIAPQVDLFGVEGSHR
jgi:hypothetical protein